MPASLGGTRREKDARLLPAGGAGTRDLRVQRCPNTSARRAGKGHGLRYLRVGLPAKLLPPAV